MKIVGTEIGPNRSSAPASPVQGQTYFDTTTNHWYTYDGTVWRLDVDGLDVLTPWKDFGPTYAAQAPPATSGTQVFYQAGFVGLNVAANVAGIRYFNPADFNAGALTTKVRFRATAFVGGTAPYSAANTITVGFATVATWMAAAAAARAGAATLNAALTSTSLANTVLTTNSQNHAESAAATLTAGYYAVYAVFSAATAANSNVDLAVQLQYQQV